MIVCLSLCDKYHANHGLTKVPIQCFGCGKYIPLSDVKFGKNKGARCPCCSAILRYGYKRGNTRFKLREDVKHLRDKPIIWSLAHDK